MDVSALGRRNAVHYLDGPSEGASSRLIFYGVADLFLLFTPEPLFTLNELSLLSRAERVATARYDASDRLVEWSYARADGRPLRGGERRAPPPRATRAHRAEESSAQVDGGSPP